MAICYITAFTFQHTGMAPLYELVHDEHNVHDVHVDGHSPKDPMSYDIRTGLKFNTSTMILALSFSKHAKSFT